MPHLSRFSVVVFLGMIASLGRGEGQDETAVHLPPGVRAEWDMSLAWRQTTATRERICLNGLWRWQPADATSDTVPTVDWGYFKVPGCWPGISDYMQKDCQTLYPHPRWQTRKLAAVSAAWYQRTLTIPAAWSGRRIGLSTDYLNSFATVWVDGQKAGEIRFPAGDVDLTSLCLPGSTHLLSLLVVAMPLKGVMLSYSDTFGARQVTGTVERRGLCGDVYLVSKPAGPRAGEIRVGTSVRRWQISCEAELQGLLADTSYRLRASIAREGRRMRQFSSQLFRSTELNSGHFTFTAPWKPDELWDTITPTNQYLFELSLLNERGQILDVSLPVHFGFREFWIDGRDFYLNGSRIWLCAVPLDNAQIGAAWATYEGARESMQRLKSFGINFVYTHNYGCEPGTHLSYDEVLRAADDEGMLVSFSQPHFGQYQWNSPDADRTNGYAQHAAFYVRVAQNHPSVICYAMSHNATGTEEEMNPDMIDGIQDYRNQWSANNVQRALRAEAIVKRLDPDRIVYHHSSGNLGSMHTANFYANFAPIQEMSDWLQHWATTGVKPLFLCEYGVPIFWDWMMYRGWYKGVRTFGSAQVPWEFCLAEWDAQFLGAQAYQLTDLEKDCLRWEARQFRAGKTWHRWDYPRNAIESPNFDQRNAVMALYLNDNWPAFRTWGISAVCPWDHGVLWKLRPEARHGRKQLPVDWTHLQQPGFSPDYVDEQMEWMNVSYERSDWQPTSAAQALVRNNMPLLAYLGGKPSTFTAKDHNFFAGELVEKQLILINNSRQTVDCNCSWAQPWAKAGSGRVTLPTGQQARLVISSRLPANLKPGRYDLRAIAHFSNGTSQEDALAIDVLPHESGPLAEQRVALFDPKDQTRKMLDTLGVRYSAVDPSSDLSNFDVLIVGKEALVADQAAPDINRVRQGLKVILFEQTSQVLQNRFGFRVEEYGLRSVFKRVPDHPLTAGLGEENLCNWRGSATLLPSRLSYKIGSRHAPEVSWCGIPVTRLWRAGNRGNVASVLIEKPARGNFLPILDGGFGLQFSPLMEYREEQGLVLFCQMDVTGRTENDPAAELLVRNILSYVARWKPAPEGRVVYAGRPNGRIDLERIGISPRIYQGEALSKQDILVVGTGGGTPLHEHASEVAEFLQAGGDVLALGLDQEEANMFLPFKVETRLEEHIATFFEPFPAASLLAGVSPADVHNRDPRALPLVSAGASIVGDGVLATSAKLNVVFCQLVPGDVLKGDESTATPNVRRTYRRATFLINRLLANMGADGATPLLARFSQPVDTTKKEERWLEGFYLDTPQEWDDPYRFFCW